jgi:hypothetical protein
MRRRRDNWAGTAGQGRRVGSWLAVCLLLVQLIAAASHFHPEDFAFLKGKADAAVGIAATAQGGAPLPAGGQPSLPAHDDCPLCFNLHVVGASALPAPTALALPGEHAPAPPMPGVELVLTSAPHLLFQTRAPPIL